MKTPKKSSHKIKTYVLPAVLPKDRTALPDYTLDTIASIKLIRSLTDKELKACLNKTVTYRAVFQAIGSDTNPNWFRGRVAEELYNRGLVDSDELDHLTR